MCRFAIGPILRVHAKFGTAAANGVEVHIREKAVFQYIYAKCMAGLAFGEVNKESKNDDDVYATGYVG